MIGALIMTKLIIGIGALGMAGVLGSAGYFYFSSPLRGVTEISIKGEKLLVEIAESSAARVQGLSGRDEIGAHGMLFLFDTYGKYGFWMRGMRFPIDIVWIRDDRVIGVEHNVPASNTTIPRRYYPSAPINRVLELPASDAARRGIEAGSSVL